MLQVVNQTPFVLDVSPLYDTTGADVICVTIKATFLFSPTVHLAGEQLPLATTYKFYGTPHASSLQCVPEIHLPHGGTSVVLLAAAHAPRGRPVRRLKAGLSIAGRQKVVQVVGDRVWRSYSMGICSWPKAFVQMPLTFEHAFGGAFVDAADKTVCAPCNPLGRGFRGKRPPRAMRGMPLPNVVPLGHSRPRDVQSTQGFGFVPPVWDERRRWSGTYDAAWEKTRAPFLPDDFDLRFFRSGPADLYFDTALQGGERVALMHLTPQPITQFALPRVHMQITARGAALPPAPPTLEMVLIEPDERRFCLTWRTAIACDKAVTRVEEVLVQMQTGTI